MGFARHTTAPEAPAYGDGYAIDETLAMLTTNLLTTSPSSAVVPITIARSGFYDITATIDFEVTTNETAAQTATARPYINGGTPGVVYQPAILSASNVAQVADAESTVRATVACYFRQELYAGQVVDIRVNKSEASLPAKCYSVALSALYRPYE